MMRIYIHMWSLKYNSIKNVYLAKQYNKTYLLKNSNDSRIKIIVASLPHCTLTKHTLVYILITLSLGIYKRAHTNMFRRGCVCVCINGVLWYILVNLFLT